MSYLTDNGTLTFGNVTSSTYSVWIKGGGTYNAARRKFEVFDVPGRSGGLTIAQDAFEDIEHTYECFIADNFATNVEGFRNALMALKGMQKLSDSYHTSEFYRARYMAGLEVDVAPRAAGGSFTLVFVRDPRRFLTSGDTAVTVASGGKITNPTLFNSKPLIRVTGYGQLTIGSQVITIAQSFQYVDIDSEIGDCYHGTDNANGVVSFQSGDMPELIPGDNNVSYTGNITKVEITPRWYKL